MAAKKSLKLPPLSKRAAYVNRPSQATKAAPSKRLKARRAKRAAQPVKGYFPNPSSNVDWTAKAVQAVLDAQNVKPVHKLVRQAKISYAHGIVQAYWDVGVIETRTYEALMTALRKAAKE